MRGPLTLAVLVCGMTLACRTVPRNQENSPGTGLTVNGKLWASFFQQKAAEYQALCFQAYATARFRLDEALANRAQGKKLAIVTDLDETVLDNSPYAVHRSLGGKDYDPVTWAEWTARGEADTLAGALDFFRYAASRGVEVFYVTNREEKERDGTLKNLRRYPFPFADSSHLMLRKDISSKEIRREQIAREYEIVLLIGDNLSDFDKVFDKRLPDDRLQATRGHAAQFGRKYIVLPNVTYGDWEGALYQYRYQLTESRKDSLIRRTLKGY